MRREQTGAAPRSPVLKRAHVGNETLEVIVLDETPAAALAGLSASERAVVRLALEGLSNRAIAAARGTSTRTIANQMAAIFRKLSIGSRAELAARLSGR